MCWKTIVKKSTEISVVSGFVVIVSGFGWNKILKAEVVRCVKEETATRFEAQDKKIEAQQGSIDLIKDILIDAYPDAYKRAKEKRDLKKE